MKNVPVSGSPNVGTDDAAGLPITPVICAQSRGGPGDRVSAARFQSWELQSNRFIPFNEAGARFAGDATGCGVGWDCCWVVAGRVCVAALLRFGVALGRGCIAAVGVAG